MKPKSSNSLPIFIITSWLVVMLTSSCMHLSNREETSLIQPKQWVYVCLEVPMLNDSTDYFYFGQMETDKIQQLNKKSFLPYFTLSNIRYWNDSDKLELYEDESSTGTRLFRIKDIVKLELLKGDPVFTEKTEDLAENARAYRFRIRK